MKSEPRPVPTPRGPRSPDAAAAAAAGRGRLSRALAWLSTGRLVALALALGVTARLSQWLGDRSFWFDESAVVLALREKSLGTILEPLSFEQGGPVAFLVAEKLVADTLGEGELPMRLPALVLGLAGLGFAALAARRALPRAALPLAVMIVAGSGAIYYSSEVKQYSGDLAVAALVLWLALRAAGTGGVGRLAVLAVVGTAAPWVSHPSLFVLAGVGLPLAAEAVMQRDARRVVTLAGAGAAWCASAAAVYAVNISRLDEVADLATGNASSAVPSGVVDLEWARRIIDSLDTTLGYPPQLIGLAALMVLLGVVAAWRRTGPVVTGILVLPAAITVTAGYAGAYPAGERFYVFLIPSASILIAAGGWWTARSAWRRAPMVAVAVIAAVALPFAGRALVISLDPRERQEIEPVLAYVSEHREPGDRLYATFRAPYPVAIYAPRFGLESPAVGPETRRAGFDEALRDLARLSGRVWVIQTPTVRNGLEERRAMQLLLDQRGERIDSVEATGAAADLYVLGAPAERP